MSERILSEIAGSEWVSLLREKVEPNLLNLLSEVKITSRAEAIRFGVEKVQAVFAELSMFIDFGKTDPGHSVGHFVRDYVTALRLIHGDFGEVIDPKQFYIGFIAGCLHDVGCGIVHRHHEADYFVRHAEASAMLVGNCSCFSEAEKLLIQYAIAAHTHYLRDAPLMCVDKKERIIRPYQDMVGEEPLYFVWLPRWIDRLDMNGPVFPGRHFFTLAQDHGEFDGMDFQIQKLDDVMVPQFKEDCGQHTMLHHIRMYSNSQTNDTPYGKHDFGAMTLLRDEYRVYLDKIIQVVVETKLDPNEEAKALESFRIFLGKNVEPTAVGVAVANALIERFKLLPEYRLHWAAGFKESMELFKEWRLPILELLDSLPASYLNLPGVMDDVREIYK